MKNKFYMNEFKYFDGEEYITFNIIDLNEKTITLAVTNRGKISLINYDLYSDENGLYFEYGCDYARINVEDFEDYL